MGGVGSGGSVSFMEGRTNSDPSLIPLTGEESLEHAKVAAQRGVFKRSLTCWSPTGQTLLGVPGS